MSINGPNLVEAAPAANDMEEIDEAINQFVKDKAINILQLGDSYSAGNGAGFLVNMARESVIVIIATGDGDYRLGCGQKAWR